MKLYIKNMVCDRCKLVVKSELSRLGLVVQSVDLGEVDLLDSTGLVTAEEIKTHLQSFGFELIDDRKSRVIEKIKSLIIDVIYNHDSKLSTNLSDYLSHNLAQDYTLLSSLFSEVEGKTIEKYFISQKIERVKELLIYDEQTLSEIADRLNYSSVAHLSNQFKKVTGFTPSYFKQLKERKRQTIDTL